MCTHRHHFRMQSYRHQPRKLTHFTTTGKTFLKKSSFLFLPKSRHHSGFHSNRLGLERNMFRENFTPPSTSLQSSIWGIINHFFKSIPHVPFFLKCPCYPLKTTNTLRPSVFSQPVFQVNSCITQPLLHYKQPPRPSGIQQ